MKCEIPLTPEQKIFAAQNHDLIYKFLNENHLLEDEYYDVVAIGYLRAIRRYFSDSQLQEYSFCTVAWKGMLGALRNYNRVRCGKKHTAKILSIYAESGEDNLTLRNCREIICIFLESMLIYVMNEFSDSGGHFHGT